GFPTTKGIAVPELVWRFGSASLTAMADESGSNPSSGKVRPSTSPSPGAQSQSFQPWFILLVAEANLPDALLVREVIRTEGLPFDVYVASDGQKAIDFIVEAETDADAPCPD